MRLLCAGSTTWTNMQTGVHKNSQPENPLVSIIIPAYNVSTYIGEALDSVFIQDYSAYEVIVINDGSTDTPELEKVLEPNRHRINYIQQENRGIAAARNAAMRIARGNYIALLDADDVWMPGKLSGQMKFLQEGNFDMVYCNALLIGDAPWPDGTTFMDRSPSHGPVNLYSLLDLKVTVIVSTVIMRKDLVQQVGSFDEEDRHLTEDYDLWLRLAQAGARIGYERKVLAKYRYRADSISASRNKLHEAAMRVLAKARRNLPLNATEQEALSRTEQRLTAIMMAERGKNMIMQGDFAAAREVLSKSREVNSSWKIPLALLALRTFPGLVRKYLERRQRT